jgi:hypothetical protein
MIADFVRIDGGHHCKSIADSIPMIAVGEIAAPLGEKPQRDALIASGR